MDREQRKEYYKAYYEKNRDRIINKALEKVECEFCHRTVTKGNIFKHYETAICQRKAEFLKKMEERKNNLKNNICIESQNEQEQKQQN